MVCNREGDREEFVEISLQSDCTLWAEHPQRVTDIKFHTNSKSPYIAFGRPRKFCAPEGGWSDNKRYSIRTKDVLPILHN